MNNFLKLGYWLNINPGSLANKALIYFVIFLALLFTGIIVASLLKSKGRSIYFRIWRKLYAFSLTNFIIGLFLLFFAYEGIPVLSTRIIFLAWGVSMLAWLYFIVINLTEIPKIKEAKEKEKEFKKYIP